MAREHGLSTQAVRNYEEAGILPAATRTPNGYRTYSLRHASALRTFLALVPGHGYPTATSIMRAVNNEAIEGVFHLIDESHAQLLDDRLTLQTVEDALHALETTPATEHFEGTVPYPISDAAGTSIGHLAKSLRLQPATLRKWEHAGLLHPRRDPATGYRVYDQADVRDAKLAHQLRRGGYLLQHIAPLIAQVRTAGGLQPLGATLTHWRGRLSTRSQAMLTGAAELERHLREHLHLL